jgi:hypothetical protein
VSGFSVVSFWSARRIVATGPSLGRLAAAVLLTAIFLASGFTSSALAAPPAEFSSVGSGAGEVEEPHGVAVEQQIGDVYITDRNNNRVDKFGPNGEFILAFGWGVADGSLELQTCTTICLAGLEGSGSGQLALPTGTAVDNDLAGSSHGDVYVGDVRNHRVEKFGPAGEFLLMVGGEVNATTQADLCLAGEACQTGVEGPGAGFFEGQGEDSVAVGPDGDLYVGDANRVQKFSAAGVLQAPIALPGIGSVEELAVDSAGDLYVKGPEPTSPGVHKYDGSGVELGSPRDPAGQPFAITIGAADQLFVDDGRDPEHRILGFDAGGEQILSFDASEAEVGGERGIAFSDQSAGIFVLNGARVRFVEVPGPGPHVVPGSQSATSVQPTTATLNATVNPEGPEATTYHFEYGTTTAYGQSSPIPAAQLTGGEFEDQSVASALSNLQPRTVYHFRVVAENVGHPASDGPDQEFTTLPPVSILATSVSQVSATTATLEAELNPNGLPSEYHFEYGLTAAYGESAPTPEADAGAGDSANPVSVAIEGLQPDLTYHYRVVAHNTLGLVDGEDHTFTTQGSNSSILPDGREWELVSPVDKHGSAIEAIAEEGDAIQAATSGDAITYGARGPTDSNPAGSRSLAYAQIISRRGADGWVSENATTPNESISGLVFGVNSEYRSFSADLSLGGLQPEGATPLSPYTSEKTPYLRLPNGEFTPLVVGCPPAPQPCPPQIAAHKNVPDGTVFGGTEEEAGHFGTDVVQFRAANPDLSDVILTSPAALTPNAPAPTQQSNVYEWSAGQLQLISILPDGDAATSEGLEGALGRADHLVRNAISSDGSRVVFETSGGTSSELHLFLRDVPREETVQLDLRLAGVPPPSEATHPVFQGASTDDSRIFFTDGARLTQASKATDRLPDLYMCTIVVIGGKSSCSLKDLSLALNPSEAASVQGVTGLSEDGERIYFAANGVLANGAQHGNCHARGSAELPPEADRCNLYSYDVTAAQTKLVATLSAQDAPDWEAASGNDLGAVTARVSPSGRYVAFMSLLPLSGYDNRDVNTGERDVEVFLYDAEASGGQGGLRCVSCNPSGGRPHGVFDAKAFPGLLVDRPQNWEQRRVAASLPGWTRVQNNYALYQSAYLSDAGRLFFNAADALAPQDSNGVEDVYEYELPQGPGQQASDTCTSGSSSFSPAAGGCLELISAGTSPEESAFLDASGSGDDVFFLTASKLSSQDIDGALDVYDAHACSVSSPCIAPPPPPAAPCSGETCQRAATPPGEPTPQSSIFVGPGNPKARCAKGKISKGGKCVKKEQKKSKKHSKKNAKHKKAKGKSSSTGKKRRSNSGHGAQR